MSQNQSGMSHIKIMLLSASGIGAILLLLAVVAPRLFQVMALPLLLLICPVSMLVMMTLMRGHGSDGSKT